MKYHWKGKQSTHNSSKIKVTEQFDEANSFSLSWPHIVIKIVEFIIKKTLCSVRVGEWGGGVNHLSQPLNNDDLNQP